MKLILHISLTLLAGFSAVAQGTIDFANRNIPGVNGGATYNIPIYATALSLDGAGLLPGGASAGLFLAGASIDAAPIVSSTLRTDTPANAAYFATSSQTATIPGFAAGTTPQLVFRAWQGSSYGEAVRNGLGHAEGSFTAQPLGGTPPAGGLPIPTPTLTGLIGPMNNGFALFIPEPSTIALTALGMGAVLLLVRR